jgi:outer membrane protein
MKTMILSAALLAGALATPTAALAQRAPAAAVVVVDTDRIYRECNACRTAQSQLQSQLTALQARQTALAAQLRPEGQSLQAAVNALNGKEPDAALTARIKAFQTKEQNANAELSKGQQNIQSIQANVLRQINDKLQPAISSVMTARGANLALDVGATLARSQGLDVTTDVLAAVNAGLPSVSLTPLPASQQQKPQGR